MQGPTRPTPCIADVETLLPEAQIDGLAVLLMRVFQRKNRLLTLSMLSGMQSNKVPASKFRAFSGSTKAFCSPLPGF